jgi:hypothetical protein
MRKFRLYMLFQWAFFLPIILPLCLAFGAIQGAVNMVERVFNQMMTDVSESQSAETTASLE